MDYTGYIPDNISLYIFDLDGTLVDSLEDLTLSINWILQKYKFSVIDRETVRLAVGNGAKKLLLRSFQASARLSRKNISEKVALSPEALDEALILYHEYYNAHCTQHTQLYCGIREWLENLSLRECKLSVLTNKPEIETRQMLCNLGIIDFFKVIVGPETYNVYKPDPSGIYGIQKRIGISAEQTVMIGDSSIDIQTARNAGVLACGITGGLGDVGELIASLPDILIERGQS